MSDRPWVVKISILTLNFPKIRVFQLQSLHFSTKKFWQKDFPTAQNWGVPPATTPLIALKFEAAPLPFVVSGAPGRWYLDTRVINYPSNILLPDGYAGDRIFNLIIFFQLILTILCSLTCISFTILNDFVVLFDVWLSSFNRCPISKIRWIMGRNLTSIL